MIRHCYTCHEPFEDPARGRPRKYCDDCRKPHKRERDTERYARDRGRLTATESLTIARDPFQIGGDPFKVDHFRAFCAHLLLDSRLPFELEDFQAKVVEDLFAGYPEIWLIVPEGNGKTTLMAALALYHGNFKPGAEVLMAASSRDQCELMYRQAVGFIERAEGALSHWFRPYDGYRRIKCLKSRGRIQVFAADARTGDGVIPTLALIDELHRHRDLNLFRTWRGKLEKRDGQLVTISTAGEPGGEFENARKRIRETATEALRDGPFVRAVTEEAILHEWAVPEDGDVEDLELVASANPFSGVTVEKLRRKRNAPTMTVGHWRRFVCNLATWGENAAIMEGEWRAATVSDVIPDGEPRAIGLDVAWKWDTTAIVPYWQRDDHWRLFGPARILEPPRDGSSLDPARIEQAISEEHERGPIHTVVMDPTRAEQLAMWIRDEIGAEVVERGQSNTFAVMDYERFMEALRNGWLHHTGDPGLTRHVLNAIARMLPDGKARFDRPVSTRRGTGQDSRVIDALSAASMVHTVMTAPQADSPMFISLAE